MISKKNIECYLGGLKNEPYNVYYFGITFRTYWLKYQSFGGKGNENAGVQEAYVLGVLRYTHYIAAN